MTARAQLQRALEATAAERDKLEASRRRIEAQEAYVDELRLELERRLRDGTTDSITAQKVATALIAQLAADPLYGLEAVAEALRDALIPGGEIRIPHATRGASSIDADEDAELPLEHLSIQIRAKPAPEVRHERATNAPCPDCPDCGSPRRWVPRRRADRQIERVPSCSACGSERTSRSNDV